MNMTIDMETVFRVLAGATPLLVAWISRRPRVKILKKQSSDQAQFGGRTVTDGSFVKRTDGTKAHRLRVFGGRVVVEWSDGKMTDLPKMIVRDLLAFGPSGSTVIR